MLELKINRKGKTDSNIYTKNKLVLEPGITNLIGCNGCGKSTLLEQIEKQCVKNNIPVYHYNDRREGGHSMIQRFLNMNNTSLMASMFLSSEGERIRLAMNATASSIRSIIEEAKDMPIKHCVILFDSIDSGLSIDGIRDLKEGISAIPTLAKDVEIYIIIASNSYEMTLDVNNMDTHRLAYKKNFSSYNSFCKFIMQSRTLVNDRYNEEERRKRDERCNPILNNQN